MSKTAFILSGGGAKGAFQVGALRALDEAGIRPDVIYGTSVGALNAAGYAYTGLAGLDQLWRSIRRRRDILSINWKGLFSLNARGLYTMKPLRKKIRKLVRKNYPTIDAYVCSVDIQNSEVLYTKCGASNFARQVEASAAIPVAMEPVDGYVDGGVREQTPLDKAIRDGADNLVVILCNPHKRTMDNWKIPEWPLPLVGIGLRAIEIMEHEIFINDIERCHEYNRQSLNGVNPKDKKYIELKVFSPPKLVLNTLEFNAVKIARGIQQGYDTVKSELSRV